MTKLSLQCRERKEIGKGHVRRLRRLHSFAPAEVYGDSKPNLHIMLDEKVLFHAAENESFFSQIMELDVDGAKMDVIVRQLQRHPHKQQILHVDFLRVSQTSKLTLNIPLHFINEENCVGVKRQGGVIFHEVNEVQVTCLPSQLPEYIAVDLADIELGDSLHLSDLSLPEGVSLTELEKGETHDIAVVRVTKIVEASGDEEIEPTTQEPDTPST